MYFHSQPKLHFFLLLNLTNVFSFTAKIIFLSFSCEICELSAVWETDVKTDCQDSVSNRENCYFRCGWGAGQLTPPPHYTIYDHMWQLLSGRY